MATSIIRSSRLFSARNLTWRREASSGYAARKASGSRSQWDRGTFGGTCCMSGQPFLGQRSGFQGSPGGRHDCGNDAHQRGPMRAVTTDLVRCPRRPSPSMPMGLSGFPSGRPPTARLPRAVNAPARAIVVSLRQRCSPIIRQSDRQSTGYNREQPELDTALASGLRIPERSRRYLSSL